MNSLTSTRSAEKLREMLRPQSPGPLLAVFALSFAANGTAQEWPETARLADNSLVILWGLRTTDRVVGPRMKRLDETGGTKGGIVDLDRGIRLGLREDPWIEGNRVCLVSDDAASRQLQPRVIEWKNGDGDETSLPSAQPTR